MVLTKYIVNEITPYLAFTEVRDNLHALNQISTRECLILRRVTRKYLDQESIRVREVLNMEDIGSQATLHRLIKKLTLNKMLVIEKDKHDLRVKCLVPAEKTLRLFKEFSAYFK